MTVDEPFVSIAIPFYNPGPALLDAVRSVFAQTYRNWELLLVDDGSTDGSLELAESIRDSRVRVFSDGQNRRLAARLNEITGLARHSYIARMDADDLMARCRIWRQMAVLVREPGVDLVSTGVYSLDDKCFPVGRRCVGPQHRITPRGLLAGQSGIVHASVLARKQWLQRNPYREDVPQSEDTNLWVRAYSKNDLRARILPEPLYFYREDGNVTVQKLLLAYHMGRVTVREDAVNRFAWSERLRAVGMSYAKSTTVTMLARLGRLDVIRQRRNRVAMTADETASALADIREIQMTKLSMDS